MSTRTLPHTRIHGHARPPQAHIHTQAQSPVQNFTQQPQGPTPAQVAAICAPKMTSNLMVALLRLDAMTFNVPSATVTRDWIEAVTYGDTSNAIEFLVNTHRWVERRGPLRFALTDAGKQACNALIGFASAMT